VSLIFHPLLLLSQKVMLRNDTQINPENQEYIRATNELKTMLQNDPILKLPDFNKQFTLTTDASNNAIGAVLSQNFSSKDLPIAYASRTLNKHEEQLSTIEKELLAIVWACKHFKPYIYGQKFLIQTVTIQRRTKRNHYKSTLWQDMPQRN
jgi:hypothetical protein